MSVEELSQLLMEDANSRSWVTSQGRFGGIIHMLYLSNGQPLMLLDIWITIPTQMLKMTASNIPLSPR